MFGQYFYNESMRRMTIGFGQIFNNIQIKRKDSNGNVTQTIRVPFAYAPKEKFLARLVWVLRSLVFNMILVEN